MNEIEYVQSINRTRPYQHLTEQQLADAMARADDDPAAWREFRARYTGDILSFVQYLSGEALDEDAALDRLREFDLHVLRGIERFQLKRDGGLKSWCLKIAARVVLDFARREKEIGASFVSVEDVELELADQAPSEVQPRERTAREQAVHDAMAKLTGDEQAVIWLRANTHWPDAEVARRIGRPESQVRQFRARAIEKLGKRLGKTAQRRRTS